MNTTEFIALCDNIENSQTAHTANHETDRLDIKDCLKATGSDDMPYREFINLRKGLVYLSILDSETDYSKYYDILEEISSNFNDSVKYVKQWSTQAWKDVIAYIIKRGIKSHNDSLENDEIYTCEKRRAEAAKRLSRYGAVVSVTNNELDIANHDAILQKIEELMQKIGGARFINQMLKTIQYEPSIGRFLIEHQGNQPMTSMVDDEIPYGYLYNLAIKYIGKNGLETYLNNNYNEIINLSTDFCIAFYGVQKYSIWNDLARIHNDLISYVQDLVIRLDLYTLPQTNVAYTLDWCRFIIKYIIRDERSTPLLNTLLRQTEMTMNWVVNKSSNNSVTFIPKEKAKSLQNLHDNAKTFIVASAQSVNQSFNAPTDYKQVNINRYPVIETANEYILLPKPIIIWSWYEGIYNIIKKQNGVIAKDLGYMMENFIQTKMRSHGIISYSGEYSYLLPDGVTEVEGETDFHINATKGDIIIESKKKALSGDARTGDIYYVWGDMKETIESQMQCARLECGLRIQKTIDLKDKYTHQVIKTCLWEDTYLTSEFSENVTEKERKRVIAKVTLTLKEYGPMQDMIIISRLLEELQQQNLTVTFSFDDSKHTAKDRSQITDAIVEINKSLNKINEFNDLTDIKNPSFHCRFLSMEQLYYLIRNSKSNDHLLNSLIGIPASYGTLNFWNETLLLNKTVKK